MPAVFLHSSFAYVMKRLNPTFSLPALLVGSIMPDIEVPILYYFTNGEVDRLLFHSVIGAVTVGTFVSVGIVVFVYPSFISWLFRIDKIYIQKNCAFSGTLVGLCLVGNLSHVLIDALHHEFNPLLYPISVTSIDLLRISGNRIFDTGVVAGVLLVIFIAIIITSFRRGKDFFFFFLV